MDEVVETNTVIGDVTAKYIALRDKKAELDAAHKQKVEAIDTAMKRCEAYLLNTLNGMGLDSVKTPAGTVFTKVATSATVADWPMLLEFVKANDLWPMLKKDVAKSVVQEYREEHNDLPPGINWSETRVLNIRRAS